MAGVLASGVIGVGIDAVGMGGGGGETLMVGIGGGGLWTGGGVKVGIITSQGFLDIIIGLILCES